jgi:hypothetical protein
MFARIMFHILSSLPSSLVTKYYTDALGGGFEEVREIRIGKRFLEVRKDNKVMECLYGTYI